VRLISLQPNKLVFARLGREITLDDLMIDSSLSRNDASDAWGNKEAASILRESTCETTRSYNTELIVCSNLFTNA
jgi:hypothetical protein